MSATLISILVIAFFVIAAITGLCSGLLGVGGGVIMVPVFQFTFPLLHVGVKDTLLMASATSLFIAMFSSSVAVRTHQRNNNINWTMLKFLVPALIVGAAVGAKLALLASPFVLNLIFIIVFTFMACNLFFGSGKPLLKKEPANWFNLFIGLGVGCVSAIMGIGGGALAVPIFTYLNYSIHKAIGNASVIVLATASSSTISYFWQSFYSNPQTPPFTLGYVYIFAAIIFVPVMSFCVPIGIKIGSRFSQKQLRKAFALFLWALVIYKIIKLFIYT